ncbi:MAG: hypothetical protein MUC60_06415 [Oscillatoria sp. Prado101]|nr:hypothetical protein [Oscillatoria sp. Prado101]
MVKGDRRHPTGKLVGMSVCAGQKRQCIVALRRGNYLNATRRQLDISAGGA